MHKIQCIGKQEDMSNIYHSYVAILQFFLYKPFSGFYKGNHGQNKEMYADLK